MENSVSFPHLFTIFSTYHRDQKMAKALSWNATIANNLANRGPLRGPDCGEGYGRCLKRGVSGTLQCIMLHYISMRSGWRNPNDNERDHIVGQLTRCKWSSVRGIETLYNIESLYKRDEDVKCLKCIYARVSGEYGRYIKSGVSGRVWEV